jgi:hypothetical protein
MSTITWAFKCACIFHNILLVYDGFDSHSMNQEGFWNALDPNMSDVEASFDIDYTPVENLEDYIPKISESILNMVHGKTYFNNSWRCLTNDLIVHFNYCYDTGDLWWPKGFSLKQRRLFKFSSFNARVETRLANL